MQGSGSWRTADCAGTRFPWRCRSCCGGAARDRRAERARLARRTKCPLGPLGPPVRRPLPPPMLGAHNCPSRKPGLRPQLPSEAQGLCGGQACPLLLCNPQLRSAAELLRGSSDLDQMGGVAAIPCIRQFCTRLVHIFYTACATPPGSVATLLLLVSFSRGSDLCGVVELWSRSTIS